MPTVSQVVEDLIAQKPFVQEGLSRGIINNAALAEELIPHIERRLKKRVKFSAVNMAIRRLAEKLEKTFVSSARFDKDSALTARSDLIEITLYKSEVVQERLRSLYDIVDFRKGDFLTITQGIFEIMIITNERYEEKVLKSFPKRSVRKVIRGLGSLTIGIPEESVETVGLFYIVTRALNWDNISIVDIVSTLTEMTFILRERDVPLAYDCLKSLIERNR